MNDPVSEVREPSSRFPRLGIVHILLWTAISAAQVSLLRWMYSQQDWPEDFAGIQRVTGMVNAIITGAQWTGAIVLIHARLKGWSTRLISQPGHWLLMLQGLLSLLSIGMFALITILLGDSSIPGFSNLFVVFYGVLFLGSTLAYLMATWLTKQWRWKTVFLAIGLLNLLRSVSYLIAIPFSIYWLGQTMMVASLARIAVSIWLVMIAVWDIATSEHRDWLHWAGVAAYLASALAILLQLILRWMSV